MADRIEVANLSPGFIEPDIALMPETERCELWRTINAAFAEYEDFIGKPYKRFTTYEQFIQSLTDENNHYLLIKDGEKNLAGVCYREPDELSETLYFGTLWVSLEYRNMDLASQLIGRLEREARKRGLKGMSIQLYRIPTLIDFYRRRHGFVFAIDETRGQMVKYLDCK